MYNDDEIDYETAEEILKEIYSLSELEELKKQDGVELEEYVDAYNEAELDDNNSITFREFFALKDFKETGYMRLYDKTKESYEMQRALVILTNDQYQMSQGDKLKILLFGVEKQERNQRWYI